MTHEANLTAPAPVGDDFSSVPAAALSVKPKRARGGQTGPMGPNAKADLLQRALENPPVMAAWAVPPTIFVDSRDGAQLVSVQDAGRWTGKSWRTMYRWAYRGWIKYRYTASGIMLIELATLFDSVLLPEIADRRSAVRRK